MRPFFLIPKALSREYKLAFFFFVEAQSNLSVTKLPEEFGELQTSSWVAIWGSRLGRDQE